MAAGRPYKYKADIIGLGQVGPSGRLEGHLPGKVHGQPGLTGQRDTGSLPGQTEYRDDIEYQR